MDPIKQKHEFLRAHHHPYNNNASSLMMERRSSTKSSACSFSSISSHDGSLISSRQGSMDAISEIMGEGGGNKGGGGKLRRRNSGRSRSGMRGSFTLRSSGNKISHCLTTPDLTSAAAGIGSSGLLRKSFHRKNGRQRQSSSRELLYGLTTNKQRSSLVNNSHHQSTPVIRTGMMMMNRRPGNNSSTSRGSSRGSSSQLLLGRNGNVDRNKMMNEEWSEIPALPPLALPSLARTAATNTAQQGEGAAAVGNTNKNGHESRKMKLLAELLQGPSPPSSSIAGSNCYNNSSIAQGAILQPAASIAAASSRPSSSLYQPMWNNRPSTFSHAVSPSPPQPQRLASPLPFATNNNTSNAMAMMSSTRYAIQTSSSTSSANKFKEFTLKQHHYQQQRQQLQQQQQQNQHMLFVQQSQSQDKSIEEVGDDDDDDDTISSSPAVTKDDDSDSNSSRMSVTSVSNIDCNSRLEKEEMAQEVDGVTSSSINVKDHQEVKVEDKSPSDNIDEEDTNDEATDNKASDDTTSTTTSSTWSGYPFPSLMNSCPWWLSSLLPNMGTSTAASNSSGISDSNSLPPSSLSNEKKQESSSLPSLQESQVAAAGDEADLSSSNRPPRRSIGSSYYSSSYTTSHKHGNNDHRHHHNSSSSSSSAKSNKIQTKKSVRFSILEDIIPYNPTPHDISNSWHSLNVPRTLKNIEMISRHRGILVAYAPAAHIVGKTCMVHIEPSPLIGELLETRERHRNAVFAEQKRQREEIMSRSGSSSNKKVDNNDNVERLAEVASSYSKWGVDLALSNWWLER